MIELEIRLSIDGSETQEITSVQSFRSNYGADGKTDVEQLLTQMVKFLNFAGYDIKSKIIEVGHESTVEKIYDRVKTTKGLSGYSD